MHYSNFLNHTAVNKRYLNSSLLCYLKLTPGSPLFWAAFDARPFFVCGFESHSSFSLDTPLLLVPLLLPAMTFAALAGFLLACPIAPVVELFSFSAVALLVVAGMDFFPAVFRPSLPPLFGLVSAPDSSGPGPEFKN